MKNTCGFIIYNPTTNEILIGRVTGSKEDMWSIPKGGQEANESLFEAAVRELKEEANISEEFISRCVVYELLSHKYLSNRKRLNTYLAIIPEVPQDIKCISYFKDSFGNRKPEFDLLKWVNADILLDKVYNIHYTQHMAIEQAMDVINKNRN